MMDFEQQINKIIIQNDATEAQQMNELINRGWKEEEALLFVHELLKVARNLVYNLCNKYGLSIP